MWKSDQGDVLKGGKLFRFVVDAGRASRILTTLAPNVLICQMFLFCSTSLFNVDET